MCDNSATIQHLWTGPKLYHVHSHLATPTTDSVADGFLETRLLLVGLHLDLLLESL